LHLTQYGNWLWVMLPVLVFLLATFRDSLRARVGLQAEVLALRHQLLVLQRRNQKRRYQLSVFDRLLWVWQIARDANIRRWEAGILGNLGWLYATQGQKQKALQSFNEALLLYRDLEDQRGEASILYGMARVNKDLDELSEALSHIESALSIIEKLRTRITCAYQELILAERIALSEMWQ
jgi:tetratricopeptide (TPR) repeat protein